MREIKSNQLVDLSCYNIVSNGLVCDSSADVISLSEQGKLSDPLDVSGIHVSILNAMSHNDLVSLSITLTRMLSYNPVGLCHGYLTKQSTINNLRNVKAPYIIIVDGSSNGHFYHFFTPMPTTPFQSDLISRNSIIFFLNHTMVIRKKGLVAISAIFDNEYQMRTEINFPIITHLYANLQRYSDWLDWSILIMKSHFHHLSLELILAFWFYNQRGTYPVPKGAYGVKSFANGNSTDGLFKLTCYNNITFETFGGGYDLNHYYIPGINSKTFSTHSATGAEVLSSVNNNVLPFSDLVIRPIDAIPFPYLMFNLSRIALSSFYSINQNRQQIEVTSKYYPLLGCKQVLRLTPLIDNGGLIRYSYYNPKLADLIRPSIVVDKSNHYRCPPGSKVMSNFHYVLLNCYNLTSNNRKYYFAYSDGLVVSDLTINKRNGKVYLEFLPKRKSQINFGEFIAFCETSKANFVAVPKTTVRFNLCTVNPPTDSLLRSVVLNLRLTE